MITERNRFLPGDLIAVGDLHGRFDLFSTILEGLRDTKVRLLFLGDLIDRAKDPQDDIRILDTIKSLLEDPEPFGLASVECLRGNHEDMFLGAVTGGQDDVALWIRNGGSIEVFPEMVHHAFWVQSLPLFKLVDDTLFVHAGVRPGVPLDKQSKDDLVWIREPFLSSSDLKVEGVTRVVHGHTPNFWGNPVVTRQRICLDSAAFETGALTLFNNRTGELIRVEI